VTDTSHTLAPLEAPALSAAKGIVHGFFGNRGGISTGIYSSLNCGPGSNDRPEDIDQNRARVMAALELPPQALRTLYQVHGRTVVRVDGTEPSDFRPQADAMVTAARGVALGILTADCVPVLFADPVAGVIGAAHAGWQGALAGVTDAILIEMEQLGAQPRQVIAALGPAISAESYEVGPDFPAPFLSNDRTAESFFRPSAQPGHHLFDLPGYIEERLKRAEIGYIERLNWDTYSNADKFFSFRRATHLGEPDYGRELSVIAFPG